MTMPTIGSAAETDWDTAPSLLAGATSVELTADINWPVDTERWRQHDD